MCPQNMRKLELEDLTWFWPMLTVLRPKIIIGSRWFADQRCNGSVTKIVRGV
jgi:hypothetical protein